jgi:hypothetical protein
MYSAPHKKINGRELDKPREMVIKTALETLNDTKSHRDDILAAVCYLGYRLLDGSYHDKEYLLPKIESCYEVTKTMLPPNDPVWFGPRWEASFLMLRIYIDMLLLNKPFDPVLSTKLASDRIIEAHPPQFVNVSRAALFLGAHCYFLNDTKSGDSIWRESMDRFKKAITMYKIDNQFPESFVYESLDVTECLSRLTEIKYNLGDSTKEARMVTRWKENTGAQSRGYMYKCLLHIYSSTKK